MTHGTPSDEEVTGNYIQFQTEILRQLPRPAECPPEVRSGWMGDRSSLRVALRAALIPSPQGLLLENGRVTYVNGISRFSLMGELERHGSKIRQFITVQDQPHGEKSGFGALHQWTATRRCTPIEAYSALLPCDGSYWSDVFEVLKPQIDGGRGILTSALGKANYFLVRCFKERLFVKLERVQEDGIRFWIMQKIQFGSYEDIREGSKIFSRVPL